MTKKRQRTVRPRSGKPRKAITVQINPEKHQELLDWLAGYRNKQLTILNALYAKMNDEKGQCDLDDTKPISVPDLEPDPTLLEHLYNAIVSHMDEQFADLRLQMRGLRQTSQQIQSETQDELKPALKAAIKSAMRPGMKR